MQGHPRFAARPALSLVTAGLLFMVLAGCSDEPGPNVPDYVSPKGKETLERAWAELKTCDDVKALLIFNEIINLADPLGYAAGMAGQSAGQGKPDLPVDNAFGGVMKINEICCQNVDKIISLHVSSDVFDGWATGKTSREESHFWRRLSLAVSWDGGRCKLPERLDDGMSWPSG
ncbi:hypothetical protein [Arenimonas caeni]|uniref:Uncharacterized protein n=1 Tax=Arenimonas caeni TaxID=2058085 RepID=A0A2P6MCJ7_9GAMM|nr:hypothetical protein [Arenimonas caeni]PRH83723.1 hypothetical protein C6N40_00850 [Arenimonas caeni]